MIQAIKIILTIALSVIFISCGGGVISKNIVGLKAYKINPEQINGIWINNERSILLTTVNPENGIVKVASLQVTDDYMPIEPQKYQIMEGSSWLYYSHIMDDSKKDSYYKWGRVIINDNKIILWEPSVSAFVKAIDNKKINGSYKLNKDNDNGISYIDTVLLTDSAENIIKLVEENDGQFFIWDHPEFFIKLTK